MAIRPSWSGQKLVLASRTRPTALFPFPSAMIPLRIAPSPRRGGSLTTPQPRPEPLIRNISDTARWVAVYRARESERPDALFKDTFARKLAGQRGEEIARRLPF